MAEGGGSTGMSLAGPPPPRQMTGGHMIAPPGQQYPHSGPSGGGISGPAPGPVSSLSSSGPQVVSYYYCADLM